LNAHQRKYSVIKATRKCLQRLLALCKGRHSRNEGEAGANFSIRVVISAYMIHVFPTHVFESIGPTEEQLRAATTQFLGTFHDIVSRIGRPQAFHEIPLDVTASLRPSLGTYLQRMREWRNPDEGLLLTRIVNALVSLYITKGGLAVDEPNDSNLSNELNAQIQRLRQKMRQIAGEEALVRFDESRRTGRLLSEYGIDENRARVNISDAMSHLVSQEVLANELLLDPSFQLTVDAKQESPTNRLRTELVKAGMDSMMEELKASPPVFTSVLCILKEIHDTILELAPAHSQERLLIQSAIDSSHIEQQLAHGAWDWASSKQAVYSVFNVILRICPERRATMLKSWLEGAGEALRLAQPCEQNRAFRGALEFIMDCIRYARVDAANSR